MSIHTQRYFSAMDEGALYTLINLIENGVLTVPGVEDRKFSTEPLQNKVTYALIKLGWSVENIAYWLNNWMHWEVNMELIEQEVELEKIPTEIVTVGSAEDVMVLEMLEAEKLAHELAKSLEATAN